MGSYLSNEKQYPNKKEECHSKAFIDIPDEIILYIIDFLDYFDGANVLNNRVKVALNSSISFQILAKSN
jgi:hypothetical protein